MLKSWNFVPILKYIEKWSPWPGSSPHPPPSSSCPPRLHLLNFFPHNLLFLPESEWVSVLVLPILYLQSFSFSKLHQLHSFQKIISQNVSWHVVMLQGGGELTWTGCMSGCFEATGVKRPIEKPAVLTAQQVILSVCTLHSAAYHVLKRDPLGIIICRFQNL